MHDVQCQRFNLCEKYKSSNSQLIWNRSFLCEITRVISQPFVLSSEYVKPLTLIIETKVVEQLFTVTKPLKPQNH